MKDQKEMMNEERIKLNKAINKQFKSQQLKHTAFKKCLTPLYGVHYSSSIVNMIFSNLEMTIYQTIDSNEFIEEWLSKYTSIQNQCLINAFKSMDKDDGG